MHGVDPNTNLEVPSDGPHLYGEMSLKTRVDLPKMSSANSSRENHAEESSGDSYESNECNDTVFGSLPV